MIGVCITTHNRRDIFNQAITHWAKMAPGPLVVVDDGSTVPVPPIEGVEVLRNNQPLGIAKAKNRGLARLLELNVDHFFAADDDCWPTHQHWWEPYVQSEMRHLSLSFEHGADGQPFALDVRTIDKRPDVWIWEACNGCMLYMDRTVIDTIGGYDPRFGIWGNEHRNYSMRVHRAGLTPHPFMDVPNGAKNFRILDQERAVQSSVPEQVRVDHMKVNIPLYEELQGEAYKVEL